MAMVRGNRAGSAGVLVALLYLLCGVPASAQVVERFVVAQGPPAFGEQALIQYNLVVWKRREACVHVEPAEICQRIPERIECRDIRRGDTPVIGVAPYPWSRGGVYLGPTHLFWGGETVYARPIRSVAAGDNSGHDVVVAHEMSVEAANGEYVLLTGEIEYHGRGVFTGKYFAKRIASLESDSPDAIQVVADVGMFPLLSRDCAASDRYFVWGDAVPGETWKVYAKRMVDILTPGAEFLAFDTGSRYPLGTHLDLWGSLLVVEGAWDPELDLWGNIYLLDLDEGGEPIELAAADRSGVYLRYPAISDHYVVWQERRDYVDRRAFGVRLQNGRPVGAVFPIGGPGSGDRISIDRNIVVWTGVGAFGAGNDLHDAVIGAELQLPGAIDVGDVNQTGAVNITDAVIMLNYLFRGGWKPRARLADVDGNGKIQLTDAVRILLHLFRGESLVR